MTDAWTPMIDALRAEWREIVATPLDVDRFVQVKAEAEAIVNAGNWMSGPDDLIGVLGRRRDELVHSRLIGWLLVPTNRHGLGRRFLRGLLEYVWPGEDLLAQGLVTVELEEPRQGTEDDGVMRAARADIVVRGDALCLVIENKVDAAEQPDQCERLYWAFADQADDTRYLYLTRRGNPPTTSHSSAAVAAWHTISYADLRRILGKAITESEREAASIGPSSAQQYLATLLHIAPG